MKDYCVENLIKEKGKWFAVLRDSKMNIEFTKDVFGNEGMEFNSLRCMISEYYNVNIPTIKNLKLLNRTKTITTYVL